MSEPINDGGPAFPKAAAVFANGQCADCSNEGMTLRDWFAGQVAEKCFHEFWGEQTACDDAAIAAYKFADAMLKARSAK